MKTLVKLLLLLLPLWVSGQTTVNVSPGQNVAQIVQSAKSGTKLKFAAGTYDVANFDVPIAVTLEGTYDATNKKPLTVFRFSGFDWWKGCVELRSESLTVGNQSISGIRFEGQNAKGFIGIQVFARSNIKLFNIEVTGFYHAGIEIVGTKEKATSAIEIYNFKIENSSRESSNASIGNLLISGFVQDMSIHDGTIIHTTNDPWGPDGEKSSGYAIKFQPWYSGSSNMGGKLSETKIYNITEIGKDFARWGNSVPNISFEFLEPVEHLEIFNCNFTTHLSLEHNYAATTWTANVHDNYFKVKTGQSIELDLNNAIIQKNKFDYTENVNAWNWIGNYNGSDTHKDPVKGTTITGNEIYLGTRSPILYVSTVPLQNFTISNNIFTGIGKPLLLQMRRKYSDGSSNINITGNSLPNGYNVIEYTEGSSGAKPANLLVSDGAIVTPPVVVPPVVTNPNNPTTPEIVKDTIYLYYERTISTKDSVYATFDASGNLQVKKTTTTTTSPYKTTTKK